MQKLVRTKFRLAPQVKPDLVRSGFSFLMHCEACFKKEKPKNHGSDFGFT